MPTCKLTKKTLSHIVLHASSFSQCKSWLLLPKRLVRAEYLSGNKNGKCITWNLPVQLRFIQVNFFHADYGIWRSFVYFCQTNWNFSFLSIPSYKNILLFALCFHVYFLWKPNYCPSWRVIFHSILTSVSNSHFQHLMCVMKQLFYDKNIMSVRIKNSKGKDFLSEYFIKFFIFRGISWNMKYFHEILLL